MITQYLARWKNYEPEHDKWKFTSILYGVKYVIITIEKKIISDLFSSF